VYAGAFFSNARFMALSKFGANAIESSKRELRRFPLMLGVYSGLESERAMNSSFVQTLVEIWRQALVDDAKVVVLGTERYPVRRTPKRGFRHIDFMLDGNEIRGLEQNPDTKSRWAQMARAGKKVMQFLSNGRYVTNVVDGKVNLYGR